MLGTIRQRTEQSAIPDLPVDHFVNMADRPLHELVPTATAGHWIGNHTLTHSVALGDRPEANLAREEIEEAQGLIGSCSRADKLFRPYGRDGLIGPHLFSEASLTRLNDVRTGMVEVNWSPSLLSSRTRAFSDLRPLREIAVFVD